MGISLLNLMKRLLQIFYLSCVSKIALTIRAVILIITINFGFTLTRKIPLLLLLLCMVQSQVGLAQEFRSKSKKMVQVADSLLPPDGPVYARIIHGMVSMTSNGEQLPLATIVEYGTNNGVLASIDGTFAIKVNLTRPCKLICSYLGFFSETFEPNENTAYFHFRMKENFTVTKAVVISASRKLERKFESPVTIQMLSAMDLRQNPSMNMYDRLINLAEIDVITTSVTFKTINTRGFNSSYNHRFIQRFDNMDLSMQGFNLSLNQLNGPIDLDVERIELIPGSSSALYGPNAINGLLNTTSKSPYTYKGLSVNYKSGVNHVDGIDNKPAPIYDFSLRYANTFKNEKWAYKVTMGYLSATDWKATDYRDIANYGYSNNLTTYGQKLGPGNSGYESANISGDEVTNVFDSNTFKVDVPNIGKIPLVNEPLKVSRTGYKETQLFEYKPYNAKSDISFYYRPDKHTEISWISRFSVGSSSFQIDNRAQIKNFFLNQHKFEIKGKNAIFRTYIIFENTGQTFDATLTGININRAAKSDENWMAQYILAFSGYYNKLNSQLDTSQRMDAIQSFNDAAARKFADGNNAEFAKRVHAYGLDTALTNILLGRAQFQPGTKEFDSAFNYVTNHSFTENGSKLTSTSKSWYTEYIYDFKDLRLPVSILAGANYRINAPATHGSVFPDKTIPIYSSEIGAFVQASKNYHDERIKLQASARLDKMQRFDPKFSPRVSVVILLGRQKQHSLRVSGQIGYRMPALIDQFNLIFMPRAITFGGFYKDAASLNLIKKQSDGTDFVNMYVQSSVNAFLKTGDSTLLKKTTIKDIVPEKLKSLEFGWRSFLFEKIETDMNFFISNYSNLISTQQFIGPVNATDTISPAYVKNIQNTQVYRMGVNSSVPVIAVGYTFAFSYQATKNYSVFGNYNYNKMFETDAFLAQDFIGNFNTPKNKINLGINGIKIKNNFGFSMIYRWVDYIDFKEYNKQGLIKSYYNIDLMISYSLPKYHTLFKTGGTNITNIRYTQALGAPTVGAIFYFSVLFDNLLN